LGDVTITNDAAKILNELDVQHPAAKMLVEISKVQQKTVGDGVSRAITFTTELLTRAMELVDSGIHASRIIDGYRIGLRKALTTLDQLAIPVELSDLATLQKVAHTSLASKGNVSCPDLFAEIAAKAIVAASEARGDQYYVDLENVQIIKKEGLDLSATHFINGLIIDKEVVNPNMPKRIEGAKIALIDAALEVVKTEFTAEIRISDPTQMEAFLDEEENLLRQKVEAIAQAGANVVFVQKGIDEAAQHFLAKKGILAVRRVKKSDMDRIGRATGAKIVNRISEISPDSLGVAGKVAEHMVGSDNMVFVEECSGPKAVSILLRGGTKHVVDEAERSLKDALNVIACVVRDPRIVAGGGAIEMALRKAVFTYAATVSGVEQLAAEAFGNALEIVPYILAENGGLQTVDVVGEIRAKQEFNSRIGLNLKTGQVEDCFEAGIVEPLTVIKQGLTAAAETVIILCRIDDVIRAKKTGAR
jgi:thermosome